MVVRDDDYQFEADWLSFDMSDLVEAREMDTKPFLWRQNL